MKPRSSKRGDQPVDPGLGAQVQRLLHLVEGRRYAIALHTLVDEFQKIALFFRVSILYCSILPRGLMVVWRGYSRTARSR
jgi:hypothetical protein